MSMYRQRGSRRRIVGAEREPLVAEVELAGAVDVLDAEALLVPDGCGGVAVL